MAVRLEAFQDIGSDPLRRGVLERESGQLLQLNELVVKRIVFFIADRRLIQGVILIIVAFDLLRELPHSRFLLRVVVPSRFHSRCHSAIVPPNIKSIYTFVIGAKLASNFLTPT